MHVIVITISGGERSGKIRFAFRFMDALGQNHRVGHASMEEHPESQLNWQKVHEYISEDALHHIDNPEINSLEDLDLLIKNSDVIIIDSFAKMKEIDKSFEVDTHLRKKYDGKLFLVIFQETSDGSMRGGTKIQYDGEIILHTEKFEDYRESYVYASKKRYQSEVLSSLRYNFF